MRFNRDYELIINGIVIIPPMRVSFSVEKSAAGGLNKATIRIYNLKEANRLALVKDAEQKKYIPVSLSVGYDKKISLLYKGSVNIGRNSREGTDFITEIESLDGGYDLINSFTSKTVKSDPVKAILDDMPNTEKGKITKQQALIRPRVMVGASVNLLPGGWYIDEEKLHILAPGEVVSGFIPVVTAATGLIDTPTREASKITFSTVLNPALKINGLCQLESKTAPHLNGVYILQSMSYTGDNYGTDWSQKITGIPAGSYKVL